MMNYDKEAIPESTVRRVGAVLKNEDFTMEKVKCTAHGIMVVILKWSSAMLQYHELLKLVNPKRA